MNRFFVFTKKDNYFILPKSALKHIKILQLQNKFFICVYQAQFYKCLLEKQKAKIIALIDKNHELQSEVVLAISLINVKRFEWLLQKATELGVTQIIPMHSKNVSVQLKFIEDKYERWQTILLNASQQSFRNKIPLLSPLTSFEDVLKLNLPNKYIAHEKIKNQNVQTHFSSKSLFLIGPEGGFSDKEFTLATKNFGFEAISLGKRILRSETAALFVLSKIIE